MKHIKQFEAHKNQENIGKVFIRIPSTKYFKSDIVFQLIFVKDISGFGNYIDIFGKIIEYGNYLDGSGDFFYYRDFEESFNDDKFNSTDFMTIKEFYKIYKDSYIRIFEQILDDSEKKQLTYDDYRIKQMTIPEVEHIVSARKYNL